MQQSRGSCCQGRIAAPKITNKMRLIANSCCGRSQPIESMRKAFHLIFHEVHCAVHGSRLGQRFPTMQVAAGFDAEVLASLRWPTNVQATVAEGSIVNAIGRIYPRVLADQHHRMTTQSEAILRLRLYAQDDRFDSFSHIVRQRQDDEIDGCAASS